jgi:hypothetical protein
MGSRSHDHRLGEDGDRATRDALLDKLNARISLRPIALHRSVVATVCLV